MAIISSYPVSTPQLADQVLGSNTVDATGDGSYRESHGAIHIDIDQDAGRSADYIEQLVATSDSKATAPLIASQGPRVTNTGDSTMIIWSS